MKVIKITIKNNSWFEDDYIVYYAGRGTDNVLYSFWSDTFDHASDITNESVDTVNKLLERTKEAYKTDKVKIELVEIK